MKYLYYNKHNVAFKVTEDNSYSGLKYIIITSDQETEFNLKKNTHACIVKGGVLTYIFDTIKKRERISEERNLIISETDNPYSLPDYKTNVLSLEQREDLDELRKRLRDAPQHYDLSDDKENWTLRWVDEYTSGKNTDNYQIKRLDFIDWKM